MTNPTEPGRIERVKAAVTGAAMKVFQVIAAIEHTDWSFFVGLILIHNGLWNKFDIGTANIITGTILVATPLMLIRAQPAQPPAKKV